MQLPLITWDNKPAGNQFTSDTDAYSIVACMFSKWISKSYEITSSIFISLTYVVGSFLMPLLRAKVNELEVGIENGSDGCEVDYRIDVVS
ncbi:hypothetical protein AVEN_187283-1 [Araneus ventricosus]|uniref:Uncharacterized protein n=1 Tax=Araneus ventricosus TaxID=182803 RepID=A0A4Y2GUA6_ARAVE|nr:hypothetical protein AVEN_187283-1 [Araneus ventricosus]